ncbi:MAG: hypothetical protein ACTSSK_12945 [Candidatus Heimdallarchaeota archaeon]
MSDAITWVGLAIIVAVCLLLFVILLIDKLRNIKRNEEKKESETVREKIIGYLSEKDKSLDKSLD